MSVDGELAKFNNLVTQAKTDWDTYLNNYMVSYVTAYGIYADTINLQIQIEEQAAADRASLYMLAFSLCGGTAFSVFFGSSSMSAVVGQFAKKRVMKTFIDKEWHNAIRTLKWAVDDNNKAAQFVMGEIWSKGEDLALKKLETSLKELSGNERNAFSGGTVKVSSNKVLLNVETARASMKNMLNRWVKAVSQAGIIVYDSNEKDGFDKLYKNSPFFTTPAKINKDLLAKNIELVLWLQFILDQDYVNSYTRSSVRHSSGGYKPPLNVYDMTTYKSTSKKSIDVSPHSKDYMKLQNSPYSKGVKIIEYDKIRDTIKKRINELNNHRFKEPFFSNNFGESYKNASRETLKAAEYYLRVMGQQNINLIRSNINS